MVIGIDTASVAGNKKIDWAKAKAAGVQFAILRAAYGTGADTTFAKEWPRVKAAGIVRGAYLFLRFPVDGKPAPSPKAQAEAMCKIVGALEPGDLPISLDVEFPKDGRASTGMTAKQLIAGVMEAWQVLFDHYGFPPIIYTSGRVWLDDLQNIAAPAGMEESALWLAKYVFNDGPAVMSPGPISGLTVPPPWAGNDTKDLKWRGDMYTSSNYWIRQYMGNAKAAPGFDGLTDLNMFMTLGKGDSGERVKWVQRKLVL